MIVDNFRAEVRGDVDRFSWSGIDRFKNKEFVTELLMKLHDVPLKHRENVKKQAAQIRQCLIQSAEYFQAAKSVTMATKPLLLYYGTMSLALAEVLFKGSGSMSLDAARGKNAHHGLLLKMDGKINNFPLLKDSAAALRANPMISSGVRTGTFHLWWKSSREAPVCGKFTTIFEDYNQSGPNLVMLPSDKSMDMLPEGGFSLLKCFQNTPYLGQELSDNDIYSLLVPGKVEAWRNNSDKSFGIKKIVNPSPKNVKESMINKMKYHAGDIESINIIDANNGYIINCSSTMENNIRFNMPNAFQ